MGCLPDIDEWSAASQWALLQQGLEDLHNQIQNLRDCKPTAILQQLPVFQELNAQLLEAHALVQALGKRQNTELEALEHI